jgi:hypothetical protein
MLSNGKFCQQWNELTNSQHDERFACDQIVDLYRPSNTSDCWVFSHYWKNSFTYWSVKNTAKGQWLFQLKKKERFLRFLPLTSAQPIK